MAAQDEGSDGNGSRAASQEQRADWLITEAMAMRAVRRSLVEPMIRRWCEPEAPIATALLMRVLHDRLTRAVEASVGLGWTPRDLAEVARRRAGAGAVPLLTALLSAYADRSASPPTQTVGTSIYASSRQQTDGRYAGIDTAAGLEIGIALLNALTGLPRIVPVGDAIGAADEAGPALGQEIARHGKVLSRVRALLAKAESTSYPEEAEALSAKAQELISRHALGRFMEMDAGDGRRSRRPGIEARRLWIDAPHVWAKSALINQVARANRCSAVVSTSFGYVTVIGVPADLEAVELLSTSLLVQATSAMLRSGGDSASRTTSFRRAFLESYAQRIGERLREADARAAAANGAGTAAALVPLLRNHAERVEAAVQEMFPRLTGRTSTVYDLRGWAAGRAAADLARLDSTRLLTRGGRSA